MCRSEHCRLCFELNKVNIMVYCLVLLHLQHVNISADGYLFFTLRELMSYEVDFGDGIVFRLHQMHEMQTVVTDVHSVWLSVCLSHGLINSGSPPCGSGA